MLRGCASNRGFQRPNPNRLGIVAVAIEPQFHSKRVPCSDRFQNKVRVGLVRAAVLPHPALQPPAPTVHDVELPRPRGGGHWNCSMSWQCQENSLADFSRPWGRGVANSGKTTGARPASSSYVNMVRQNVRVSQALCVFKESRKIAGTRMVAWRAQPDLLSGLGGNIYTFLEKPGQFDQLEMAGAVGELVQSRRAGKPVPGSLHAQHGMACAQWRNCGGPRLPTRRPRQAKIPILRRLDARLHENEIAVRKTRQHNTEVGRVRTRRAGLQRKVCSSQSGIGENRLQGGPWACQVQFGRSARIPQQAVRRSSRHFSILLCDRKDDAVFGCGLNFRGGSKPYRRG